ANVRGVTARLRVCAPMDHVRAVFADRLNAIPRFAVGEEHRLEILPVEEINLVVLIPAAPHREQNLLVLGPRNEPAIHRLIEERNLLPPSSRLIDPMKLQRIAE